MATLYGAKVYQENRSESDVRYDVIGNNSEEFTAGDPVTVSSGDLVVAGTTDVIYGIAIKSQTLDADNETVAKVCPGYIPADLSTTFLMGTNSDLTGNATDGGTYYKLTTATTGTVQVDVTSGVQTTTSRVVEIVKVDPRNIGGTGAGSGLRECLVRFVKTPVINVGGPA